MLNRHMIRFAAKNDNNGNPRRVYVLFTSDANGEHMVTQSWDEGYAGWGAVPVEYRELAKRADTVNVTVSQYRAYVRAGR